MRWPQEMLRSWPVTAGAPSLYSPERIIFPRHSLCYSLALECNESCRSDRPPQDVSFPEAEHVPQKQERYKYVVNRPRFFEVQARKVKLLVSNFPTGLSGLQSKIPGCYYSARDAGMALTKCVSLRHLCYHRHLTQHMIRILAKLLP